MFSKTVQERSQNRKFWSTSDKEASFSKTFLLKDGSFQIIWDENGYVLRNARKLSEDEMSLFDLMLEFLMLYPKKQLESSSFREFDYFLRDKNTESPFPENYSTNHIESLFKDLRFIIEQGPQTALNLGKLSKIQQIITLESFLKASSQRFWGDDVVIKLDDIQGKDIVLNIQAPGDLELYLDKIQDCLVDFFQDYELNCILSNTFTIDGGNGP